MCEHDHNLWVWKNDHFFSFFNLFTHVFRLKILKHTLTRIKKPDFERFLLTVRNRNYERNTFIFSGFHLFFCSFKRVFEKSCLLGYRDTILHLYPGRQSVNFFYKVYFVHSAFWTKCKAACILGAADVLYILLPLDTLAIRNTVLNSLVVKYGLM